VCVCWWHSCCHYCMHNRPGLQQELHNVLAMLLWQK
jgi:hypothetical protein